VTEPTGPKSNLVQVLLSFIKTKPTFSALMLANEQADKTTLIAAFQNVFLETYLKCGYLC
jgi:hypothetical protein